MERAVRLLLLVGLLTLEACVSTQTLTLAPAQGDALRDKSLVLVAHPVPDFTLMTAGKVAAGALFGAVGGAAAGASGASDGNSIVRDNQIPDPALPIGNVLRDSLLERHGMQSVAPGEPLSPGLKPAELVRRGPKADYLLDVFTVSWQASYFPLNWSHYGLMWSVKAALVDAHSQKVVAETYCYRKPEQVPDSPTREQLLEDRAARLKELSSSAAQACLPDMARKLLGT